MARRAVKHIAVLLGAAVLLFAGVAVGQILYGSLTGNITDASNAPLPGAKIQVLNVDTGISTDTTTDSRGVYLVNELLPGTYRVTISAGGFSTVVQEGVVVEANSQRRLDTLLSVARVNQKVTVTAAIEALQTDRTDVKTEMSSTQIANLPLGNDRNFQAIYTTIPGVTSVFASHSFAGNPTQSLALRVSGGLDTSNITLIDGSIDTNYWEQNLIAYVPPEEAIEAVNIVTTGYDAESGSANGAISNVTIKSGTNSLHGSAFEYNTDSALQSRNFFTNQPGIRVPKYVLNDFGVSLGGPIKKNKLFFFSDWDRYRLSTLGTSISSIPSAAMVEGNFQGALGTGVDCVTDIAAGCIFDPNTGTATGTGRVAVGSAADSAYNNCGLNVICPANISKASSYLAALLPTPNYGATPNVPVNNYFSAGDLTFHRDSVDLKINYVVNDKATVFARYSAEPTFVLDPQIYGKAGGSALGSTSQPGDAYGLTQNTSAGFTYTFSPHLLLDGNVGFTRPRFAAYNTDLSQNYSSIITGTDGTGALQGGIPAFAVSNLFSGPGGSGLGNIAASNPFLFRDNQYTLAANLSWVKGNHNFRFGGNIQRYDLNRFQGQLSVGVRGGFTFTGGVTQLNGGPSNNEYNSWADYLLGLGYNMDKDYVNNNPSTTREWEFAGYARDNWQVSKKLSVNYGVRWEYYPIPTWDHYGSVNFNWTIDTAYIGCVNGVPCNAYMSTGPGQVEPRLGIAYRLTEKTVIRTGYGMSSDPYALNYMAWIYPAILSQQYAGGNSYSPAGFTGPSSGPAGTWCGPTAANSPAASGGCITAGIPQITFPSLSQGSYTLPTYLGTYGYPNKYNRGYNEAWNLFVEHEFAHNLDAQIGYVGNHMVRAAEFINFNAAGPGGGNAGTPLDAKYGNANSMTINGPFTGGSYNALQTQLKRRVGSMLFGTAFTWSKTIDDDDTEANTGPQWNYYQVLDRDKALAGFDQRFNYLLYGVFNSPFGKGKKWTNTGVGAALLGGWSLSPSLSRTSGTPFTIGASGSSCNCPGNSQTADQVGPIQILGGHGPGAPYFNTSSFTGVVASDTPADTTVRFGTSGRDIVRGPGFFYMTAAVVRDFDLTERFKLQFRAECYGLPNNANFANPAATATSGGFGIISGTVAPSTSPYSSADRQMRFGLLLKF